MVAIMRLINDVSAYEDDAVEFVQKYVDNLILVVLKK